MPAPKTVTETAVRDEDCAAILSPSSEADRRETLAAIARFAAFVAPMTVVLVSAEQAKPHHVNCSQRPNHPHCN